MGQKNMGVIYILLIPRIELLASIFLKEIKPFFLLLKKNTIERYTISLRQLQNQSQQRK